MGSKRTHRSAQQWQSLVDKHANSGQSAPAFCRSQGIGYQSFMGWRKRLASSSMAVADPESAFIELTPPTGAEKNAPTSLLDPLSTTPSPICVELSLGGGIELRITRSS